MDKIYLLIISLLLAQNLSAQEFIYPEFGKLTQEEIDLKTCPFDSTADAVVLFDIGKTKFIEVSQGFNIRFTRHKRIKILTEQGFENAEINIPFYMGDDGIGETITSIEAHTYVIKEGEIQKHPLDPTTIYTERINKWWLQKKFVFPNLNAGVILELKYIYETPFVFNLPDWEFQSSIPTLHSQYRVSMIPFYEYVRIAQGIDTLASDKSVQSYREYSFRGIDYKEQVYTSVMKNIDGFKDESYITSRNDYIKKFDFQLSKVYTLDGISEEIIPTWEEFNSELLTSRNFGDYINECRRFVKKALETIDLAGQTRNEKIKTLIKFVKESFYWNGYYGKYTTQTAKDFYTKKTGNVAEINLFLLALLREAGFNTDPMILSTRDHGKLSLSYPISEKFNYVLAYVNESDFNFITDGTSPLTSFLMVPTKCINGHGLVVNKDKAGDWKEIKYSKPSLNIKKIDINIKPDQGISEVSFMNKTNSYEAYRKRSTYKNDTTEIKKAYQENFDKIFNIKTRNYDTPELAYIINFKAEKELSWINNYLLIEPFFGISPSENMLKQEKRDYPVDMLYPRHYRYDINLYMPNGYIVEKIPELYFADDDLVTIVFNTGFDKENNLIRIMGEYKFKKTIYLPENYTSIKSHIDSIVDKLNIELILKETTEKE